MTSLQAPPLSLYVHLPWCVRKCPYCDFNSHQLPAGKIQDETYSRALLRDLEFESPRLGERQVSSIFFGGGTPSLFSTACIESLLQFIRSNLDLAEDIEITLEANPGAVDAGRFQSLYDMGINRLSIGVQSFNDGSLEALGRIHDADDAYRAIGLAKQAGFENINIDLMYGLPDQAIDAAMHDINMALAQDVSHISWYQLTLEPNTRFYSHPPALPEHDTLWTIQHAGRQRLTAAGFRQYEVSAFAQPGQQSRHNLNYWQFGDYAAIGAGAHAKLTDTKKQEIRRYLRHRLPDAYMNRAGDDSVIVEEKILTPDDIVLEFMMNALRLYQGFSLAQFRERSGLDIDAISDAIAEATSADLLRVDGEQLRPSERGMNFLDDLLQYFLPPESGRPARRASLHGGS